MSRTTVEMLRAYLMTASLLAMCMDGAIVIAALVFHVPDAFFEGSMFRLAALTMLVVFTVVVNVEPCVHFVVRSKAGLLSTQESVAPCWSIAVVHHLAW